MNPQSTLPECVGWFGKIPSMGDFVTRRLPMSFVEPWDEWLAAELSAARLALADSWAETYEQAPTWCFSLGARAVDEHVWHGILVPSFDRVGRQFPLTIALPQPSAAAAMPARQWWAALVAIGRRAREPDCGADGVDQALSVFSSGRLQSTGPTEPVQHTDPALAIPDAGTSMWCAWSISGTADALPGVFGGLPRGVGFQRLFRG